MSRDAGHRRMDDRCGYCAPMIEAHHRVANHLAMISSYARLAARDGVDRGPHAQDRFDDFLTSLLAQLDAAAGLQRVLAQLPIDGEADACAYLDAICGPLARLVPAKAHIKTAFESGPPISAEDAVLVGQFVAEAVANAAKHMPLGDSPGLIRIASRAVADGLMVSITNDGPGPVEPTTEGLGARLLRSIAARLKAKLERRLGPESYEIRLTLPGRARRPTGSQLALAAIHGDGDPSRRTPP